MKAKNLALVAAAVFGMVGVDAFACSINAWTGVPGGTPIAGKPTDPAPIARYSGQCGLRAAAVGTYVTDPTPTAETNFRARFYVYTGATAASGQAIVYRALNGGGTTMIDVVYNASTGQFTFATPGGSGSTAASSIVRGRWYSVELTWASGGAMSAIVQGNAATAPLPTVSIANVGVGGQIDTVQLGWVGTPAAATAMAGAITADAYESRRNTAIGRLCVGDADLNGVRDFNDALAARNEFLRLGAAPLANGQPDADETGTVDFNDALAVRTIFLSGASACP